jgi:hypothetical protein
MLNEKWKFRTFVLKLNYNGRNPKINPDNALELRNESLTWKKSAPFIRSSYQRYGYRKKGGEASDLKQVRLGIDFLMRFLGLIELMAEMLYEQRKTNQRLEFLEKHQANTNLAIGELRVSVIRLTDEIEKIVLLDQQVSKLEFAVIRKSD